jgi:hypothetical protein
VSLSPWSSHFSGYGLIFFFIGLLSGQKINLFGEIYLGEIICGLVLLLNLKSVLITPVFKKILILLLLWFVAQLFSDLINQTDFLKAIKGTLVPVFVAIILLGLNVIFSKRYKYLPMYLMGVFIGILLNKIFTGNEYFLANPWKWGLGSCVIYCFFTFLEFQKNNTKKTLLIAGSLFIALICFANSSRSMAIILLLASFITLSSKSIIAIPLYRHLQKSAFGNFNIIMVLFLFAFVMDRIFAVIFTFQPFLELLPPEDAFKYKLQANSAWGVILGGRSELLISIKAFLDSPLIGFGSWAESQSYVLEYLKMVDEAGGLLNGLDVAKNNLKSFLIPTHSYLMGSVVWGGVFAGFFWLYVLNILIKGLLNSQVISSPLSIYISISLVWNILFSPFGADARWLSTLLLWVYLFLSKQFEKK